LELVRRLLPGALELLKSCIVGEQTALKYGKKVGDTFPIIGTIFPRLDGSAWDFRIAGIYRSKKKTLDDATLFFHYAFLEKALEAGETTGPSGVGIYVLETKPGIDQTALMSQVDALFENGPQVVQATTEAEFQAQFVSMVGNIPLLVASISGGVLIAILLAVLNTMLMSAREQTRDVGVLKALGFSDGSVFGAMLLQSIVLCSVGGALGIAAAKASEGPIAKMLGTMFPGYEVTGNSLLQAALVTLALGVVAGVAPALRARSLDVVTALRATA
jgi:putative ABC transport system permease protein